jgi:hypothetical protein
MAQLSESVSFEKLIVRSQATWTVARIKMARGWESKAVADQIEEGKHAQPTGNPSTNATERRRQAELESLRLSRSRILEQLDKAHFPAHREVLLKGLGAIERQIEAMHLEGRKI